MKHGFLFAASAVILFAASCGHRNDTSTNQEPELPRLGFYSDSLDMETGVVKSGEAFVTLMNRLGMTHEASYRLSQLCDSVFDVRKLRAGNSFSSYYSPDKHELQYVVYDVDRVHQTVFKCTDSLSVWNAEKEVTNEYKFAEVEITSSLWNDMRDAGASPLLIMKLADVYAWTVDFFGLQEQDKFRMLYSQSICEDEIFAIDTLFYATFTRDGKDLYAVRFDQGDGGNVYWNEKGESMRKAFLKAPLNFTRISSGFSYHRKHPVTGKVRPHTAVDYAAPTGTPVMSIGDGTVLSAGWAGGGGNTVKVRHNATYTTSYMHLSKYAKGIKAGTHVQQGQVIGYVGATGTATGPHLDFRVYKNGSPINPLTMESPSEEPIRPENLSSLDSIRVVYESMIAELTEGE